MKLACCQFKPLWNDWKANADFVDCLLREYKPGDIDVLTLPEMAFTGYVFENLAEITPLLEDAETGPTVLWAKRQAVRLRCHVIVGYPEKVFEHGTQKNYNSLCCVNEQGELLKTYRKSFLYITDKNWAQEGPGFVSQTVPNLGKVGFGICMDLNPHEFTADFEEYEFARFHEKAKSDLLLCCMAWIRSSEDTNNEAANIMNTINYWKLRLLPLSQKEDPTHISYFVACNRTGEERGTTFAGGSCILELSHNGIHLLGNMLNETGVLIVDV